MRAKAFREGVELSATRLLAKQNKYFGKQEMKSSFELVASK